MIRSRDAVHPAGDRQRKQPNSGLNCWNAHCETTAGNWMPRSAERKERACCWGFKGESPAYARVFATFDSRGRDAATLAKCF